MTTLQQDALGFYAPAGEGSTLYQLQALYAEVKEEERQPEGPALTIRYFFVQSQNVHFVHFPGEPGLRGAFLYR